MGISPMTKWFFEEVKMPADKRAAGRRKMLLKASLNVLTKKKLLREGVSASGEG